MQAIDIQSFSYEDRTAILPALTTALEDSGGWLMNSTPLSATTLELQLEVHLFAVLDIYAALIASGLELTRSGHLALTEACTCRSYFAAAAAMGQTISIRLEVSFLHDNNISSRLLVAAGAA